MTELHEVRPREVKGRDTLARYRLQLVAAAYASLQILDGKAVDRVYCDYHDDFVVRYIENGKRTYHFFQVKTNQKKKHQWSLNETWGLTKKIPKVPTSDDFKKVRDSFFGKLLVHALNFGDSCRASTLLTNVHFEDDVESLISALKDKSDSEKAEFLRKKFDDIFPTNQPRPETAISTHLAKLSIQPCTTYVDPTDSDFPILAREAIFKYSEIDLSHDEADEIAANFVGLFFNKSIGKVLEKVTEQELDQLAGVGLWELLDALCISREAYKALVDGGDPKALKSASIIQRRLSKIGASSDMIEFCSQQKVAWDIWVRDKRHNISPLDFNLLQQDVQNIANGWNGGDWAWLQTELNTLAMKCQSKNFGYGINADLLLGGVFSMLIRNGLM